MGSECLGLSFEKPIKKKRALPKDADWGDRLLYWIMPPGNEGVICQELGVASLATLFGTPTLSPEDTERLQEASKSFAGIPTGFESQPDRWFDAATGLVTVRALMAFAQESPERVLGPTNWGSHAAENFLPDLESLEQALVVAEQEGIRFRLRAF